MHTHAYIHTHTHASYIHTCIQTYIPTHTHTHTHTHIHTNLRLRLFLAMPFTISLYYSTFKQCDLHYTHSSLPFYFPAPFQILFLCAFGCIIVHVYVVWLCTLCEQICMHARCVSVSYFDECTKICICICMYVYTYMYIHVCMHTCMHVV